MDQSIHTTSIMLHFSILPDPRKIRNQLYPLSDIISTAILSTLCSMDDYVGMNMWTEEHLDWLQTVGICTEGAPSHDTYERFFKYLDPNAFRACFMSWTQSIAKAFKGVIAIDGKTLCNSGDDTRDPIHMVSAFAAENSLVLGQLKCSGKGKELETIQQLLAILDIKGATITIDAAGCHKVVIEQIRDRGGDYLIALKGNQETFHNEVENFFRQAFEVQPEEAGCDSWSSEEKTRGRIDTREIWACGELDWLPQREQWRDLKSVVCVRTSRKEKDKASQETRYYISSLPANAEKLASGVRSHWSIENKLHWQLDVTFREDLSRVRKGNGAENLSVVRRATLNLLKEDKTLKVSLQKKRIKASWRREYLLSLISTL